MELAPTLLGLGVVVTGLVSGLLYGWAVSVIPGTRQIPDAAYVDTMQNVNREIINPLFVLPFMGVPVLLGIAAWAQFRAGDSRRGWLLLSAAGTYAVGVLGVTIGGNIPLNDALDRFDLAGAGAAQLDERRHSYETPWNRWHGLRTVASVGAFGLVAAAALVAEDG